MPNPSAQYKIRFDGHVLPGYAQSEDLPINARNSLVEIINRDGGVSAGSGSGFKEVSLSFHILSRLSNDNPGILHLGDCLEQYREALRIVTRVPSASTLFFGETAHWLVGRYASAAAPLAAPDNKRISYQLTFDTNPWFYGPEISNSDVISGDDVLVLNMTDTRETYPSFEIPSGITHITVDHTPSGKGFTLNGPHSLPIIVDCARLMIKDTSGVNRVDLLSSGPDFGIFHMGSGSFSVNITEVDGAGNVRVYMNPRLER
jgi:hypothetical protein